MAPQPPPSEDNLSPLQLEDHYHQLEQEAVEQYHKSLEQQPLPLQQHPNQRDPLVEPQERERGMAEEQLAG